MKENYLHVSVRKIKNGYVMSEGTPDGYTETFHDTKPVIKAAHAPPKTGGNSLSGAIKAIPKD